MKASDQDPKAIVIGASVGAIEALTAVLPTLAENYPVPVIVVVHVPSDKKSLLSDLFNSRCKIRVKEAEDKEEIQPATVYFAPAGYHLLIEPDFRLSLSNEEPVLFSRPSIDVLFQSAADAYGDSLVGVILTGANADGAAGLRAVCDAGGIGLVQSPDSSEGDAMPLAALQKCPEAYSLSLVEISDTLSRFYPD